MTAPGELQGKVAIITGSAKRMGRATALRLAQSGAYIVVNSKGSPDAAEATASEIVKLGSKAITFVGDVTDPAVVKNMADITMKAFGRIDILVNNIAYRSHYPLAELTLDVWHKVLATSLDSAFLCAQACAPQLKENGGTIINIGGVSAHFGGFNNLPVMTAKAALIGMTRSLAMDLAPNVIVNCVVPGRIQDKNDDARFTTRKWHYSLDKIPAGRPGTLEEVAEAVAMLCGPRSRFITGQTIHVNGGMYFGA